MTEFSFEFHGKTFQASSVEVATSYGDTLFHVTLERLTDQQYLVQPVLTRHKHGQFVLPACSDKVQKEYVRAVAMALIEHLQSEGNAAERLKLS